MDLRYLSFYSSDSDVIRVTGYLVKRSELEKLAGGEAVLQDTTALGLGAARNGHILELSLIHIYMRSWERTEPERVP